MISKVLVVCLCFVYICSGEAPSRKIKRSDIDLQTCLNNFDVHKDKIIRTQDSKDMGAKYINEIDLGSREECSRLCCETESCDVFVFEEKNSGSCYLFQCGPPEDFKCKFTHHSNYSSAILAISRHLPDLESQIKLTKHEQDLSKLNYRKKEDGPITQKSQIPTTVSTSTSTKVQSIGITGKTVEEAAKCSRYQFECRSTKECIAIYNACDGIPQCADGSDEAPELGCPDAASTPSPTRLRPIPYEESPVVQNRPPSVPVQKLYPAQQPNIQRPENDFIRPDNAFVPLPPTYNNEPPGSIYSQNQPPPNWMSQHLNQLPPQYPPYGDKNSHIFNHKENGIQVSEGQGIRYNKPKGAMQILHRALGYSSAGQSSYGEPEGHDNQKFINYIDDMYRQHPQYPEKWPSPNQADLNNRNPFIQAIDQTSRTNWVPNRQETEQRAPVTADKEMDDHEHKKMAYDLQHSKDLMEKPESSKDQKIKIEKHIIHENTPFTKTAQYKMDLDLQDGIAETPGGAVLSLTLGLIITCVMALLIGCRLRMVRRRIRRGGKSYAHDADYLVNGMYL